VTKFVVYYRFVKKAVKFWRAADVHICPVLEGNGARWRMPNTKMTLNVDIEVI